MKNWTLEQNSIFDWFKGICESLALVVIARAGTGKTTTILQGIIGFALELTEGKGKVLYGAFNKKNQLEASSKVSHPSLDVKTWHSVGYGIIAKFWGRIQAKQWVETDRIKDVCPDCPTPVIMETLALIRLLKNFYVSPTLDEAKSMMAKHGIECPKKHSNWNERLPEIAINAMEKAKTRDKLGRISFEDMVWLPHALEIIKPTYNLIVADEAQDLNALQLAMLEKLLLPNGRICLVGDDRQAMYGFRGAMPNGLQVYKEKLNALELGLKTTFRCGKNIVAEAQSLVPDYVAFSGNHDGAVETLGHNEAMSKVLPGEVILSRVNAPLLPVCLEFIRQGKRARIEGKDIGKDLQKLVESLQASDIGDLLNKLGQWAQAKIAKLTGWNATEQAAAIQDKYETLKVLCEECATLSEVNSKLEILFEDTEEKRSQTIVLSSIHKAKGLEWDRVFLFRDTCLRSRADSTPEQLQEEKNILYVGITRAKQSLVFTTSKKQ